MRPLRRQATRRRTGILLAAAALTIAMLAVASVARVSGAKAAEGGESLLEGAVPVPPPQQPGRVGEQHDLPPYPDAQLDETGHGLHESHPRAQAARRELVRMERERLARRRRRREDNATTAATVEDGDSTADPPLFETFRASVIQGVLPTISYLEDAVPSSGRLVPAHYSVADDPLRTFSIEEPVLGCSNTSNHRELTSVTAKHNQCIIAGNAGFFGVSNGMCHGNLISDGQLVQNTGRQNANFGIRRDGTIVVGYLTSNEIAEIEASDNPFQQLVAGVVWLVRDGEPYIDESSAMEDMSVQETGITFVSVRSGRAALGHDADGRVVLYQVDGKTNVRGVNLYELAELLIKRGVRNAINLDGGGSMTSVLNNQVVSYPSDTCKVDPSTKCERTVTTIVCLHDARCDPVDCSGHGTCRGVSKQNALDGTVGTCDCEFGWRPPSCSVPVDPCVDADYEDYLDWYAATHNNTLPTDNTGGGDAGGGDVPDNDRRRLYFAPAAMVGRREDPPSASTTAAALLSSALASATPSSATPSSATPSSHTPSSATPSSHTPSVTPSSHTPSSHTPSSHTPSSHTPSSATPSVTPSSHTPRATPSYAVGPAKCHINSTCSYAGPGRRTCSCNAGQYGNGTFCQAIPAPCPVYSATPSVTPTDSGSNSFVNPECVPWAYWLTAVAGVALGSIAVSLWLLLTRSKVRRPHPGGPRESNGEALSTKASPPRIRIGSASSGSSSGEADGDITSLSPPSPFLDDELAQASATPGAVMAMTTFVKRVVGSQSKSKSHGAGPPFHKLTGQADTEPLVEDDNDDDDDDDDASEPSDDSADESTHSSAKKKPSSKMKLVSAAARLAKGGAASAAAAASSGKHTWPAFTTSFTHSSPSPLTTKLSYVDTASAINTPHYTHAAVLPTIPPQEQRFAQSVVDIVRAHYTRGANAAEAAHMRKYMRSLFHYFGLKSPQRTALSSAILTELAEKAIHPASFDASAATIRLLFAQPERECHYFAMNFLQHFVVQPHVKLLRSKKTSASANKDTKDPTPAVATTGLDILNFTKEIAQLHAWWDTIDGLSTTVVGEVVMANRDELEPVMRAWIADDCLWVRRMALLHQLQYKEKTNEDLLFTFVLARHDETDFFIQKAMGWALRQHARVRPSVVRAFVRNFRHVLPRLTQKEAMKHL